MPDLKKFVLDVFEFLRDVIVAPVRALWLVTFSIGRGPYAWLRSWPTGNDRTAIPLVAVFLPLILISVRFQDFSLFSELSFDTFIQRLSDYVNAFLPGSEVSSNVPLYHLIFAVLGTLGAYALALVIGAPFHWRQHNALKRFVGAFLGATTAGLLLALAVSVAIPFIYHWSGLRDRIPNFPYQGGGENQGLREAFGAIAIFAPLGIGVFYPAVFAVLSFGDQRRMSVQRKSRPRGVLRLWAFLVSPPVIPIPLGIYLVILLPQALAGWIYSEREQLVVKVDCQLKNLESAKSGSLGRTGWTLETIARINNKTRDDVYIATTQPQSIGICWGLGNKRVSGKILLSGIHSEDDVIRIKKGESEVLTMHSQTGLYAGDTVKPPLVKCAWNPLRYPLPPSLPNDDGYWLDQFCREKPKR